MIRWPVWVLIEDWSRSLLRALTGRNFRLVQGDIDWQRETPP